MQLYNTEPFYKKLKPFYGSFILTPLMLYFALNRGKFFFIDWFNLLIHEGGHGVFMFFGRYIYTMGGTLMQIILPTLFIVYCIRFNKKFSAQLAIIWLGENLINISVYAADARAHKLPLLGGKNVYHDWTYLLNTIGIIQYDIAVGYFFYCSAIGCFIIAFLLPLFLSNRSNVTVLDDL
ncbi:MAG: hypothetical protein V1773_17110 [bacterium]